MTILDEYKVIKELDFPCKYEGKTWVLAEGAGERGEACLIATAAADGSIEPMGRFDAATGNVLAPGEGACCDMPAVLNVGNVSDATGQLKARQEAGNYLRVCRWDRLETAPSMHPNAQFRTLPQCGCGGYLGVPKFFDEFAEMAAHVYCLYYLREDAEACNLG